MSEYNKEPYEDFNDGLPKNKRVRKRSHKQYRLTRGTRVASLVFTLLATFIGSNIAIYAANTYYNLDTGEIVVSNIQRVTEAIRADGGIVINGSGNSLEVASGNVLFTGSSITQTGTGTVTFSGNVGMGGVTTPTFGLEVGGTGIVARFAGRVQGAPAEEDNEFVTRGQVTGGGVGGGPIIDIGVASLNSLTGGLDIADGAIVGVSTNGTDTINLTIKSGTIGTTQLADGGVTTDKIADEAVAAAKLADNAVIERTIANNAVTTDKINDLAVTAAKLANNAVLTRTIQDGAVTNEKLDNDSITINVAGNGIEGGGTVALGGATTLTVDIDDGDGGLGGTFFRQGGNSFSETAELGTIDAQDISIIRNETERMRITAAGAGVTGTFNVSGATTLAGATSIGGDISLTGGNRSITATAGNLRLASSSNRIEFGNAQNFIDNGDLTISGNFNLSGLTISNDGTLTASGNPLVLGSDTGRVELDAGSSLFTSDGYDLTAGSVVRDVLPIFGYDLPVRCGSSGDCGTPGGQIMSHAVDYDAPSTPAGATREYRFTIHYSNTNVASTDWEVRQGATVVDTFTVPASTGTSLDGSATIHTTAHVEIPTSGEWAVYVTGVTGELQVNQIFLTAVDVIQ